MRVSKMIHQAFEERLSVHFLIIIALYFVHHNKKLQILNNNLLKYITGRYRMKTDIHMHFMLVVFSSTNLSSIFSNIIF